MNNMKEMIYNRLMEELTPDNLEVIDESHLHIGHAGYGEGGRHFAIIISAPSLTSLSRIEAHRKIYSLLKDPIFKHIHALKIKIK